MSVTRRLLDLFRPPEGLVGQGGLLSAFSASVDFLEEAACAFNGLSPRRRAHVGVSPLLLFLDAHATSRAALIKPSDVPGVIEVTPRREQPEVMHAKVGLLCFGRGRSAPAGHIRLLVSTANWTQASARRQLELAWQLDLAIVDEKTVGPAHERADVRQAADFFETLSGRYEALPWQLHLDRILKLARNEPPQKRSKRFLHTLPLAGAARGKSIIEHLRDDAPHDRENPRDVVICAAGFYEATGKKRSKPEVLGAIEGLPGLKSGPRFAVARSTDAGALAGWRAEDDGWHVMPAVDPADGTPRSLHAKFVYVGRRWGAAVRDGWLYLGSGNMTRRGLLWAPGSAPRGNVEAGVVVEVADKLDADALAAALFVALDHDPIAVDELETGHDDELDIAGAPTLATPPILVAREGRDADGTRFLSLTWSEAASGSCIISGPFGELEVAAGTARIALGSVDCPSALNVEVNGLRFAVAVIDIEGRVCRVAFSVGRFEDALADLLRFPLPRPGEDSDDDDANIEDASNEDDDGAGGSSDDDEDLRYPLQDAMELLERLGAAQAALRADQLHDWLGHLEMHLRESFSPALRAAWRALGVPIFSTLKQPGFCPPNLAVDDVKRYRELLRRVAAAWEMPHDR